MPGNLRQALSRAIFNDGALILVLCKRGTEVGGNVDRGCWGHSRPGTEFLVV